MNRIDARLTCDPSIRFAGAQLEHAAQKGLRVVRCLFVALNKDAKKHADTTMCKFVDLHPELPAGLIVPRAGEVDCRGHK